MTFRLSFVLFLKIGTIFSATFVSIRTNSNFHIYNEYVFDSPPHPLSVLMLTRERGMKNVKSLCLALSKTPSHKKVVHSLHSRFVVTDLVVK